MSYHGDIALGDTIHVPFTTTDTSGIPTTLAGTPVISAYIGASLTQLTAGITLSVDHDGVTGYHMITVVASSGNGYATATNVALVITTGTVSGNSVVGYVAGTFSIENRSALRPATAGRTLVVDAAGLADANAVKVGPSGSGTAQTARDVGGNVDTTVSSRLASSSLVTASGTATAGAAGSITVSGLSATDDLYKGQVILLMGGTGVGQARAITAYNHTTGVITVDWNWITNPASGTTFVILGLDAAKLDSSQQVTSTTSGGTYTANITQIDGVNLGTHASGQMPSDLRSILGTLLTETVGGYLAAAFKKFFDKASPTGTINSLPDAVPQAAGGLITSTAGGLDMDDLAADVDATETRVTTALPNAAPQAAGGLITSTAGSLDLDEMNADIEAIQTTIGAAGVGLTAVSLSTAGIDAILDRRPVGLKRATAGPIPFAMLDTDGNPAPGKTVTAVRQLDAATSLTATSLTVSEVDGDLGLYILAYSADDVDGLNGTFVMTADGCQTTLERFITHL